MPGGSALRQMGLALFGAVVMVAALSLLNAPHRQRLDRVRQALASAGYADAQVSKGQRPSDMARCEVGQIERRGSAYAWRAGAVRGLYCLREDGRPSEIILDRG